MFLPAAISVPMAADYTGAMKVLETILRYSYLWTKIRVQGRCLWGRGAL